MKPSFDVLRDAWIDVLFLDGTQRTLCVLEILEKAHEIKEIFEKGVFEEYGIHQFLISFLICSLKLEDADEKLDLFEEDKFNMQVINDYILLCEEKRAGCFNLFGDNPFYQNKYTVSELKGTENSISKLDLYAPSGRNSVHLFSEFFIGRSLNYSECVKMLISHFLFQPQYDGPYTATGPNGQMHPLYFVIKGINLFDTLILNILTKSTWGNNKYSEKVVWEQEPSRVKKEVVPIISLAEGLTFQNRNILLGAPLNGNVSSVYITAGKVYVPIDNIWRQPNCSYYTKGKNEEVKALIPFGDRPIWTYTGKLFSSKYENNLILLKEYNYFLVNSQKMQEFYSDRLNYNIYFCTCKEGNKTPILRSGCFSSFIPVSLINSEFKLKIYEAYVLLITTIGNKIKSKHTKKVLDKFDYFTEVELRILNDILLELGNNTDEFLDKNYVTMFKSWGKTLEKLAIDCLNKNIYLVSNKGNEVYKNLIDDKRTMIYEIEKLINISEISDVSEDSDDSDDSDYNDDNEISEEV